MSNDNSPARTPERIALEDRAWVMKHEDCKGTSADGTRTMLYLNGARTESWPLSMIPDAELLRITTVLDRTEKRIELHVERFYAPAPAPAAVVGWRVELDGERKADRDPVTYAGDLVRAELVELGAIYRVARVISPHTGRETRSYVVFPGRAFLRGPCFGCGWSEMDRAVAAALSCAVVPYAVTGQGIVSFPAVGAVVPLLQRAGGTGGCDAP